MMNWDEELGRSDERRGTESNPCRVRSQQTTSAIPVGNATLLRW